MPTISKTIEWNLPEGAAQFQVAGRELEGTFRLSVGNVGFHRT